MPNRTDQPAAQPTPVLPEPSYARLSLQAMAGDLEQTEPAATPMTEPALHRAYVVCVAKVTGCLNLPDPVADEVSEKVGRLLPPINPGITYGEYAPLLRTLARTV